MQSDNMMGHVTLEPGRKLPFPVQNVYPSQYAYCVDAKQSYEQDI